MTRARQLRLSTAALALAGIGIASYLSYIRATDATLICPTTGCEKVQHSSYSEVAGVPVAYVGVVGYVLILATTVRAGRLAAFAGAAFAAAGTAFALYLLVVPIAVIDAVCIWCATSDGVLVAITVLAAARLMLRGPATPALADDDMRALSSA
jgi:uncharacterized membrane protein